MSPETKRKTGEITADGEPARKRVTRKRKGKLEALPRMPLDILYEIFSALEPFDILKLSRADKEFRALLMARTAAPIWKAARENVPDLPEPFPGMSEPAYANLCFSPHCHVCLKPNVQSVIWEFRVRLCNDCKLTNITSHSDALDSTFYLEEWSRLLPHIGNSKVIPQNKPVSLFVPDMVEVENAWNQLPDAKEAREQFLITWDQRYEEIKHHAELCSLWSAWVRKSRTRKGMYEIYTDELDDRIMELRPTVLTDLAPEYRPFFPLFRDFVSIPGVQALVDPHHSEYFDETEVEVLVEGINDHLQSWEADCKNRIEELIRHSIPDIPDDVPILELAITNVVACRSVFCSEVMTNPWPNSAIHECTSRVRSEDDPHKRDTSEWYEISMDDLLYRNRRSADDIIILVEESKEVITLCGQDPLRVTAAEMDALDPRIQWDWKAKVVCSSIMDWRQAIAEKHRKRSPPRRFGRFSPFEFSWTETVRWGLFPDKHRENLARFEVAAKAAAENHKAQTRRQDGNLGPAFPVQIVRDGVSAGLNSVQSLWHAQEEGRLARKSDIYGAPKKRKPKKPVD